MAELSETEIRLNIERARRLASFTTDEKAKLALLEYAQKLENLLRKG